MADPGITLYPAIDLRGGRVVRLRQGDFDQETAYGDDPVARAEAFAAAGARWVHVVDLDAARTGEPRNRDAIERICRSVPVRVQAGGGVRDEAAAAALLDAGVERVVIGTAAVEQSGFAARLARRWPGQVALGIDVRGREVAVRGWREGSGRDVAGVVDELAGAGAAALVLTQIEGDGMLSGPDLTGLTAVLDRTPVPVIASGGVGSLDDLRRLARLDVEGRRLAGVVVGRALYDGHFTLEEALAAAAASTGSPSRSHLRARRLRE
jgi:phosphoribosylformimino-5-aminoimidazole carboxamide ribotide isomerase